MKSEVPFGANSLSNLLDFTTSLMSPIPVGVNLACNLHNYLPMQFHLGILHKNAVSLGHSTQKCSITLGKDRCCIYMRSQDKGSWLQSWWQMLCPEVLWGCPSGRALLSDPQTEKCCCTDATDTNMLSDGMQISFLFPQNSLLDGDKWQQEEMPRQGQLAAKLVADALP